MGGLHVVITISSSVETCVMGEEREGGREWEEGRMKRREVYTRDVRIEKWGKRNKREEQC